MRTKPGFARGTRRRLYMLTEHFDSKQKFNRWCDRNNIATCNHCGAVLNQDGSCPGLCVPCERD